jgi:beta-lactamase regulating signal transducer with metallopeptidase domain
MRHFVWVAACTVVVILPLLAVLLPGWHVLPGWAQLAAPTSLIAAASRDRDAAAISSPDRVQISSSALLRRRSEFEASDVGAESAMAREDGQVRRSPPRSPFESGAARTVGGSSSSTTLATVRPEASPANSQLRFAIAVSWLAGLILCAARLLVSAGSLWRRALRADVARGALAEDFGRLCREMQLVRGVRLLRGDERAMPMAWGVFFSRVLVPRDIENWPSEQRRSVLMHELGHVLRRDALWQWIVELARAVYWFHPLVWFAAWRAQIERERACDDLVLNRGVSPRKYANHLLDIVARGRRPPAGAMIGVAMASPSRLEGRLRSLFDDRRHRRPVSRRMRLLCVAGIVSLAAPLAMMRAADSGAAERRDVDLAQGLQQPAEGGPDRREREKAAAGSDRPGINNGDPEAATADTVRRVRELIYFFRSHRVFSRDEEWAQTIRELAKIGKPAVPELVAELDRTDRTQTILSLGFALRAIGDPRAVPALIRAIPKTLRPLGSDCGVCIVDPDLRNFMQDNQNYAVERSARGKDRLVACGRPVNEIVPALERITGHREPPNEDGRDPLRGVFLGGTPEQQADQRRMFKERKQHWEEWWGEHWDEFVTEEELQSVELPQSDDDPVEAAGLARFGPLFPTGPNVRLRPVQEVHLDYSGYRDGKAYLDFETGRSLEEHEGLRAADWDTPERYGEINAGWRRREGLDAWYGGMLDGVDLYIWLVGDDRWDTIEDEILSGEPLALGRESSYLVPFGKDRNDLKHDRLGTFLFTTREGGRGIVQVFPKEEDSGRRRLQYRMWVREGEPPRDPPSSPAGQKPSTRFGKPQTAVLDMPGDGKEFALSLKAGRKAAPAKLLKPGDTKPQPAKVPRSAKPLYENEAFLKWCRESEVDGFANTIEMGYAASDGGSPPGPSTTLVLFGLDMLSMRVLPRAFDEMTVEKARDVLGRSPEKPSTHWMMIDLNLPERPDTFLVQTRDGSVGLVQIEETDKAPGKLTVTWKLHRGK